MTKTQIVGESNKLMAVIVDFGVYLRLKEIEEERKDYLSVSKIKAANRTWTSHEDLQKELGL